MDTLPLSRRSSGESSLISTADGDKDEDAVALAINDKFASFGASRDGTSLSLVEAEVDGFPLDMITFLRRHQQVREHS